MHNSAEEKHVFMLFCIVMHLTSLQSSSVKKEKINNGLEVFSLFFFLFSSFFVELL